MSIFSQIITTTQNDPDIYKYPSVIEVTPTNNIFRKDDFVSLVSLTMKNLYSTQGKLLIVDTNMCSVISIVQFDYELDNPHDLVYEFNRQQSLIKIEAVFDNKFRRFKYTNISSTDLTLQTTGNLQNILGIHQDIQLANGAETDMTKKYDQLDDNSMRIQYVKICCEQINACMQNTIQYKDQNNLRQKTLFDYDVLTIVNRSSNFCYSNKNLDVHLQLLKNPPLTFRILDQDNRPINISFIVIELQFYQKQVLNFTNEVTLSSQIKGHNKMQMFMSIEKEQQEISLPRSITQIALSDVSGQIQDITLSPNNSKVIITFYDCELYPMTYNQVDTLSRVGDNQVYNQLKINYVNNGGVLENLTLEYVLFNEPEFKDYQNKFIDYDFMQILAAFIQRVTNNKLKIQFTHDKKKNIINYKTQVKRNDISPGNMILFNRYYCYFDFEFVNSDQQTNIINRVFNSHQVSINNAPFRKDITNLPEPKFEISQGALQVNLSQMFCYSTMFYIVVEQQDFDQILGVVVGNNLILQPTNKSVFLWKSVYSESKKLNFRIMSYVENEMNQLVKVESSYIPNMQLRLLVK
ncbi:Hypothetical_protein [Hexamita inflata]|uniref:Hypothetical_protein n=1 Tax=Hexamita inflata TaxID=28002 RepID=A0AA86Q2P9_9EUKA|nr:Hypothetical protein HINF_LOCUS38734 [Hexamita inflata]